MHWPLSPAFLVGEFTEELSEQHSALLVTVVFLGKRGKLLRFASL